MKTKIYSIYDSKAEAYNQPIFVQTKGQALRAFTDEANNPDSNICRHAADFTLFEIGEYDQLTGNIQTYDIKTNLGCAIEFKKLQ